MKVVKRYKCTVAAHQHRLSVNVFTADPKDVEVLAKIKAAEHLKKFLGIPTTCVDVVLVDQVEIGQAADHEPDIVKPSAYINVT